MTYRKPKFSFNTNKVGKTIADSTKFISSQFTESNSATSRKVKAMSAQQNINFTLANSKLIVRRMRSANNAHARLVATGKEDGWIRTVYEWVADYLIVTVNLIWTIIRTVSLFLMMLVIRTLLIVFFTAVVFYLLYLFITS